MSRIKYVQFGVDHAHASKISVYRESDDYEVIGVVEPDARLWEHARQQDDFRDLELLTAEEALNTPGLQVAGIETRVSELLSTAETCIDAGLHVHLDKPAGESLSHYRRILDKAAQKHLAVQMGYMYRFSPAVILLRQFLNNGWLGDVFEVHTVMSKAIDKNARESFARYSGGTMFELGCHILDLVIGVLGEPAGVTPFPQHAGPYDDDLLDNMLAVLSYPRALATAKSSVMEVEGFARRHFVVCGTEGTFHIQPLDAPAVRLALSQPRGKYEKGYQDIKFDRFRRYVGDAADLAAIVRNEKDPEFCYKHDYIVQRTVLQASGLPIDT